MATLATSQQWLQQSSLLIEARPDTTKITCRYSVKPKPARRVKKSSTSDGTEAALADTKAAATATAGQNPRAKLVLKAVDPASGVCLRYKTTKAAEVSRLVQMLGRLSRRQAGLVASDDVEDVTMADADVAAPAAAPAAAAATPAATPAPAPAQQQQQQGSGGGGGGKGKKKKGKR